MKRYCRRHAGTGSLGILGANMLVVLSSTVNPLCLQRRIVRCAGSYLIAYDQGLDIVEADAWIRKHRSHRGVSKEMDAQLNRFIFRMAKLHRMLRQMMLAQN